ncbi:Alpha/Beta hydrolase protein [Aspergillus pseudotamarii]|uniref:Carboxylic ester hydrolase n=1 Tax=Aspergillus pseudotamarii TaxID=132259 RepID=A0A5N6T2F4_ASPPS|nr:Alpha/Beta hydrolase protein [Aspergillus pseudotamarii]KAE8140477.1 Alpha/Beta hydrolase protein [Aspergillus pseudotamarii]
MWSWSPIITFLWLVELVRPLWHVDVHRVKPVVTIRNGTLLGVHNARYHQDFFLGIPYAQPPVGGFRYEHPQSLNESWEVPKQADSYGFWCHSAPLSLPGYTQNGFHHEEDEDCLTLNVVRPSGVTPTSHLPVLVYIYGGGLQEGGSADQRYNMSFLVQESVKMGSPTIGVSFNYRVSGFGFLSGRAFKDSGLANLGLYDQRKALHWIQENIAAFGGDPTRVTIQGESSGALSVGYHLLAYDGRDDGLFRAAITQSGAPLSSAALIPLDEQEQMYQDVLDATGCATAIEAIDCLRRAPVEALKAAFQQRFFFPVMDGKFITDFPSNALKQGRFVQVPLLIGSNLNEGTGYIASGMFGPVNSPTDLRAVITGFGAGKYLTNDTLNEIVDRYLQLPIREVRADLGTVLISPSSHYGSMYGYSTLYIGDYLVNAPKRYSAQMWAAHGTPVYSYLFAVVPNGLTPRVLGAAHFQEVAFVFRNSAGVGFTSPPLRSFDSQTERRLQDVSHQMTRMWLSFVGTLSPNNHQSRLLCCFSQPDYSLHVVPDFKTQWPVYQKGWGANLVFRLASTTVEPDTWRSGIIQRLIAAFDEYKF